MKQGPAVHFVAGAVPGDCARCAANAATDRALRHARRAPCRSSSAPPMHAAERTKRDRSAIRTHAMAIAPLPLWPLRWPVLPLPFRLFPAQFLQIFRTLAQILCSADGALTASNLLSKDRASGSNASSALRYQAATWFDQNGLSAFAQERRGAIGESPVQQENQRARTGTRTRYPIGVQDSDAYPGRSARLLRQDKAGFPASGTSFLRFCLHIVFGRAPTLRRDQRAALFPIIILFQRSKSRRLR